MILLPDHPEIQWIERTGYPSWMQVPNCDVGYVHWEDDEEEEEE